MALVFAATAFIGIVVIIVGVSYVLAPERSIIDSRLSRYGSRQPTWKELADVGGQQRGSQIGGLVSRTMERAVANRGFAQQIALDMARADLKLTVSEFLVISLCVALVTTLLAAVISKMIFVGLVFGICSLYLPRWYVKGRERKRLNAFNGQLGDTVGIMANSLRSGYSLLQAMELVARETPPPMGQEFGRVVREVGLGLSPEQALSNLVRRINSEDLDLMVTAINVQHEVGGNLSRILDTIGSTIRERVRIKGEIRVLTAQQSMAGYIISGLPLALAGVMLLINPTYIMRIFEPGWFICMPICGGIGIVLGFLAMRKIVAIDV